MKDKLIIFDFYKTIYDPETNEFYPGTELLLEKLNINNALALVTTESTERVALLMKLDVKKYFLEVVLCNGKRAKCYSDLADALNKSNNDILIIGDRDDEELRIAKQLNIAFIKVDPKKRNPINTIFEKIKSW